eukprot:scaffold11.g3888.t1
MALFLVAFGGAVVVEVHRALTSGGGSKDVQELRLREGQLRRQLEEIQEELERNQKDRELTVQEAAQLAAVNQQLALDKEELSRQASSLAKENEELHERTERLLEQQQVLEQCAESLKAENSLLIGQFEKLKIKYEQETEGFQEQLTELKTQVSGALDRFTTGDISAEQLIAFLGAMGVELRAPRAAEGMEGLLPDQLNSARSREERLKLLDKVELNVDDSWVHQMRLVTAEPGRAARLLLAGAQRAAGDAGAAGGFEAAALGYAPPAKLVTPPKDRLAAALPGLKVPPLKLKGQAEAVPSSAAPKDENANAAQAPVAAPQRAALPAAAAKAAPAKQQQQQQGGNKPYLTFLPSKKASLAAKKNAAPAPSPRLQLDLPLGSQAAGGRARMPFDAVNDDDLDVGSRAVASLWAGEASKDGSVFSLLSAIDSSLIVFDELCGLRSAICAAHNTAHRAAAFTSLIQQAARSKQPEKAVEIFEAMQEAGADGTNPELTPNTVTYAALISAYEKGGQLHKALEAYHQQVEHRQPPDIVTYSSLVSACEREGEIEQAVALVDAMHQQGLAGSIAMYNGLIGAAGARGAWQMALDVFLGMQAAGVEPSVQTVTSLLAALAQAGQVELALWLLAEAEAARYELGPQGFLSVLGMLSAHGRWGEAAAVHAQMGRMGVAQDASTAGLVLAACVNGGNSGLAARLSEQFRAMGLLSIELNQAPPAGCQSAHADSATASASSSSLSSSAGNGSNGNGNGREGSRGCGGRRTGPSPPALPLPPGVAPPPLPAGPIPMPMTPMVAMPVPMPLPMGMLPFPPQ